MYFLGATCYGQIYGGSYCAFRKQTLLDCFRSSESSSDSSDKDDCHTIKENVSGESRR